MAVWRSNFKLRARILSGDEPAWLKVHPRRSYLVAVIRATPTWSNLAHLEALSTMSKILTWVYGVEFVCDHIIPLNHPRVCGLNVPENIQLLTRAQNAAKSNSWNPDQGELF